MRIIVNRRRFKSVLEELRELWVSCILSRDKGLSERFMDHERYCGS